MLYNAATPYPLDLAGDYPCAELTDAHRTMLELVEEYTTGFIVKAVSGGSTIEVQGDAAVALWPKEEGYAPVHICTRFGDERVCALSEMTR